MCLKMSLRKCLNLKPLGKAEKLLTGPLTLYRVLLKLEQLFDSNEIFTEVGALAPSQSL